MQTFHLQPSLACCCLSHLLLLQVTALNRATQRTESFTARYLLSTLPLGVLKASYRSIFAAGVDSAAAARQNAIARLGMGLLNKVRELSALHVAMPTQTLHAQHAFASITL
jgi:hypothetical protein